MDDTQIAKGYLLSKGGTQPQGLGGALLTQGCDSAGQSVEWDRVPGPGTSHAQKVAPPGERKGTVAFLPWSSAPRLGERLDHTSSMTHLQSPERAQQAPNNRGKVTATEACRDKVLTLWSREGVGQGGEGSLAASSHVFLGKS